MSKEILINSNELNLERNVSIIYGSLFYIYLWLIQIIDKANINRKCKMKIYMYIVYSK